MRRGIPLHLPDSPLPRSRSRPTVLVGTLSGALGPRIPRTKMSHAFMKRPLSFDSKPVLPARSRCPGAEAARAAPDHRRCGPSGKASHGRVRVHALRPTSSLDGSKMGGYRERHPDPGPRAAELFALRPRSVRPSHVPSERPWPLHAWPPSGPGHRTAFDRSRRRFEGLTDDALKSLSLPAA